jgi:ABC-type xylose transport system permease subunit
MIVIITNEVLLLGVPIQVQMIIKGAVIVIAATSYARKYG